MGFKKSLKKLLSQPTEMRLSEVKVVLAGYGYKWIRNHGSHYIFTKKNHGTIIIPVHKKKVAKRYLQIIRKRLNISTS